MLARSGACTTRSCFTGRSSRKSIGEGADPLIRQIAESCRAGRVDSAIATCQGPPYWHTALAQLMGVALANRPKGLAKVKQLLVMEFHTEIIAAMENRLATISTIVRMGPLLGLLGTVASMIGAFGRIGSSHEGRAPRALAQDISLALWATGAGLLIATPMMIFGNDIHAKTPPPQGQDRTPASGLPRSPRRTRRPEQPSALQASRSSQQARAVLPR